MKIWPIVNALLAAPELVADRMSKSFWPSDAGQEYELDGRKIRNGGCRRAQYFRFMRYPPDERGVDFGTLFVLNAGHFFEGLLQEELKKAGIWLGSEVSATVVRMLPDGGQYRVTGNIDHLVRDDKTGKPHIIECKSTAGYRAAGVVTPKDGAMAPDPGHVLQLLTYLVWAGMPEQGYPQTHGTLLYLTRDGDVGEHEIWLDPKDGHVVIDNVAGQQHWTHMTVQRVFKHWDDLYAAIRDGKVPERDYERQWSRETILWKLQHGDLGKTDTKTVSDRVKTGYAGDLLEKGDWQCTYCKFQKGCYAPYPEFGPSPIGELTDQDILASSFSQLAQPAANPHAVHVGGLPS